MSAFSAPRTLNDRVTCSDSSFSRTSAEASADSHGEWTQRRRRQVRRQTAPGGQDVVDGNHQALDDIV